MYMLTAYDYGDDEGKYMNTFFNFLMELSFAQNKKMFSVNYNMLYSEISFFVFIQCIVYDRVFYILYNNFLKNQSF